MSGGLDVLSELSSVNCINMLPHQILVRVKKLRLKAFQDENWFIKINIPILLYILCFAIYGKNSIKLFNIPSV